MLYRPVAYAVRQALSAVGVPVSAVSLLQVLSAVFGALGLGFSFLALERLIENWSIAVWVTLILGVSWSYWTISTDPRVRVARYALTMNLEKALDQDGKSLRFIPPESPDMAGPVRPVSAFVTGVRFAIVASLIGAASAAYMMLTRSK